MDNKIFLSINRDIKNKNDLMQRYKQAIDRISQFKPFMIGDRMLENYYKFCVEGNIDVDEFMRLFNINEEKNSFVTRANKVIEESKKTYFQSVEKNVELTLWIGYDEYTKKTIKDIYTFISILLKKEIKSLDIKLFIPENGLNKFDLQNLLDLSEVVNQDLIFMDPYDEGCFAEVSLSQVIKAYRTMNDFIDRINSLNLSPFEKFLLVHDYVANRIYKPEDKNVFQNNSEESRSFVNVMTRDNIVCVGYAQTVKEFCKHLGIECEYIAGAPLDELFDEQGLSTNATGHAANIIHIVDEKYGIDGYYFCDACWDSKQGAEQTNRDYFYAALPIQDIDRIGQSKYFSEPVSKMDIPKTSKPISVDTFRKALNKIYSNQEQVEEDLQRTVKAAYNLCEIKSDNDFIKEHFRQREHALE